MIRNGYYIYEFWKQQNIWPHRLSLNLTDKIILKRNGKYVAFSNLSMYSTWKNIKKSCKHNKFKISAAIWKKNWFT